MTTTRLPIWVWFMAAPVRAMADKATHECTDGHVACQGAAGSEEKSVPRKKLSRNAPCPCGSGKKYKHCCYGEGGEDDLGPGEDRQQPQYPIGTVAMYSPDGEAFLLSFLGFDLFPVLAACIL
jgi:hypothetical protein